MKEMKMLIDVMTSTKKESIAKRHKIEKDNGLTGYHVKYRPIPLSLQRKTEKDVIKTFKGHLKNGAKFMKDAKTFGFEVVEVLGVKDGKVVEIKESAPKRTSKQKTAEPKSGEPSNEPKEN